MLAFWWISLAAAEPWADPAEAALAVEARAAGLDRFGGVGLLSPYRSLLLPAPEAWPDAVTALWAPELTAARGGATGVWVVRPEALVSFGPTEPMNAEGDVEPGLATARLGVGGTLIVGPWTLRATPQVEAGLAPSALALRVPELWTGVELPGFTAGFGKTARWIGPGRHGNLMLTDNALPPWLGSVAGEGRLPGVARHLGRLRGELAVGWLDLPREDVQNPGLLLLDARWRPAAVFEVGATRMAIFGGADRPPVNVAQLLLPTEPHIYDDPDQELADQNELAALDFRVTLPIARWVGGPVRYVEGWWEYGGEDVIARETGGVKLPSLAGVGNLFGGELAVGPIVATAEYTQLMDDYFRWYVGHRVYHDGFTQADRALGHPMGGDGQDLWAALAVDAGPWRARVSGERVRRVGVIEARNDRLFALSTEEHRLRLGLDAGRRLPEGGLATAGVVVERITGEDFVPGADGWGVRVALGLSPARAWSGPVGRPPTTPPPLPGPLPPPLPSAPPPPLPTSAPPPLPSLASGAP